MRRVFVPAFVAIGLTGASLAAAADTWAELQGVPGVRKFVAMDRIKRHGAVTTTQEMMSFEPPVQMDGQWMASLRWANEYHCGRRWMRVLTYAAHTQAMGRGAVAFSGEQTVPWAKVPPGSMAAEVMQKVCDG